MADYIDRRFRVFKTLPAKLETYGFHVEIIKNDIASFKLNDFALKYILRVSTRFGRCLIFPMADSKSDNYVLQITSDKRDVNWDEFDISDWSHNFGCTKFYWTINLDHPELVMAINNFCFWIQGYYGYFNSNKYQNDHDIEFDGNNITQEISYNFDLSFTLSLSCYPELWTRIQEEADYLVECSEIKFFCGKNSCVLTINTFNYSLSDAKKEYAIAPRTRQRRLDDDGFTLHKNYSTEPLIISGSFDECWKYLKLHLKNIKQRDDTSDQEITAGNS